MGGDDRGGGGGAGRMREGVDFGLGISRRNRGGDGGQGEQRCDGG